MTTTRGDDATARHVAHLCRRLTQAAGASSATGILLRGAWGAGTSWILRRVVAQLRRDGVGALLRVADGATPLDPPLTGPVLVVDDAHRLSDADALLLRDRLLNGNAPVLLGGRSAAPYPEPIAWALAAGVVTATTPPEPRTADLARLLPSPGRMHEGSAARILETAGGRLGFSAELIQGGVAAGSIRLRNGLWRITGEQDLSGVRERAELELRLLDPVEARALRLAFLLGWVPDDEDLSEPDRQAIRTLAARGYLTKDARGGFVPDPPAVAAAARSSGERIPRDLARLLVDRHGAHAPATAAVRWHRDAGLEPSAEWLGEAAREAWSAGRAQDALDILSGVHEESVGILRLRAEILADLGRREEGLAVLQQLERVADSPTRRAVAAERASITMWDIGRRDEALAISSRIAADAEVRPLDRMRHALLLFESGRLDEAARRARELLDGEAADAAGVVLAAISGFAGDGVGALELARGSGQAAPDGSPGPPVGILTLVLALTEAGELREARQLVEASLRDAGSASRSAQAWLALSAARCALFVGSLADARTLAWEAAEIFADLDQSAMHQWALATRLLVEAALRDERAATESLAELEAHEESRVVFIANDVRRALAWGAAVRGDRFTARQRLREAAEAAGSVGAWGLAGQAWHDLVMLGDPEGAAEPLDELRSRATGAWVAPRAAHARAAADREAKRLLDVAAEFESFDALRAAAAAAADARTIARERGDRATERRANGLLNRWSAERSLPIPAETGAAVALTPRELEVAELAASGRTSREIAHELGISHRTAQNLLHRAYHKFDVHDRGGLGAALAARA